MFKKLKRYIHKITAEKEVKTEQIIENKVEKFNPIDIITHDKNKDMLTKYIAIVENNIVNYIIDGELYEQFINSNNKLKFLCTHDKSNSILLMDTADGLSILSLFNVIFSHGSYKQNKNGNIVIYKNSYRDGSELKIMLQLSENIKKCIYNLVDLDLITERITKRMCYNLKKDIIKEKEYLDKRNKKVSEMESKLGKICPKQVNDD